MMMSCWTEHFFFFGEDVAGLNWWAVRVDWFLLQARWAGPLIRSPAQPTYTNRQAARDEPSRTDRIGEAKAGRQDRSHQFPPHPPLRSGPASESSCRRYPWRRWCAASWGASRRRDSPTSSAMPATKDTCNPSTSRQYLLAAQIRLPPISIHLDPDLSSLPLLLCYRIDSSPLVFRGSDVLVSNF